MPCRELEKLEVWLLPRNVFVVLPSLSPRLIETAITLRETTWSTSWLDISSKQGCSCRLCLGKYKRLDPKALQKGGLLFGGFNMKDE